MKTQVYASFKNNQTYLHDKLQPYFATDPDFESSFIKWYGWLNDKGEDRTFPIESWVKNLESFIKKDNAYTSKDKPSKAEEKYYREFYFSLSSKQQLIIDQLYINILNKHICNLDKYHFAKQLI